MAINEITMFSDNYYETGNNDNNSSSTASKPIFNFNADSDNKTEFTVGRLW